MATHYRANVNNLKRHMPQPLIVKSVEKWLFMKNVTNNTSAPNNDAELFAGAEKVENDFKTNNDTNKLLNGQNDNSGNNCDKTNVNVKKREARWSFG